MTTDTAWFHGGGPSPRARCASLVEAQTVRPPGLTGGTLTGPVMGRHTAEGAGP